ncbi:hypothetical protein DCO57_06100 [Labrenzia sp. 011]|nr:hypothetical protein DCO57_06100 [Labrenzia sp. 011]
MIAWIRRMRDHIRTRDKSGKARLIFEHFRTFRFLADNSPPQGVSLSFVGPGPGQAETALAMRPQT